MKVNEVELIPDFDPAEHNKDPLVRKGDTGKKIIQDRKITKLGVYKDHTIYQMSENRYYGTNTRFFAMNKDDLPTIFVLGMLKNKKSWNTFNIEMLQAREGNTLKANEFYRFLMLKLPLILITSSQSYGGLKVWQKMSSDPKLTVFGWYNGKPVNVDPRDDNDTHITYKDAYDSWGDSETRKIFDMKLIAHRRLK